MNHDPHNSAQDPAQDPAHHPASQMPDNAADFSPTELPGGVEMDALLRTWHDENRAAAASGRDRLLAALAREQGTGAKAESAGGAPVHAHTPASRVDGVFTPSHQRRTQRTDRWNRGPGGAGGLGSAGPIGFGRYALLAAAMITLAILIPNLVPSTGPRGGDSRGLSLFESAALASGTILAPDGGLLEARDERGDTLGPCVLKHTDVDAKISGRFARVSVTQKYRNPHQQKIEAVYTFPLPHDAAVDRLRMKIGDRVIIGQVRERDQAREMYEAARDQGRVASLLEQERPNIFTQSVANIEPGAEIDIEIAYVQTIEQTRSDSASASGQAGAGGEFTFVFPTTVSPRYIPVDGSWGGGGNDARTADASARTRSSRPGQSASESEAPISRARARSSSVTQANGGSSAEAEALGLTFRKGLVLRAPATVERMSLVSAARSTILPSPGELARALENALPVLDPAEVAHDQTSTLSPLLSEAEGWLAADVVYPDGTAEFVQITDIGFGRIGERAFYSAALRELAQPTQHAERTPSADSNSPGAPFSQPTPGVPDAHRITPTPVRPPMRAGHEVSIRVHLDTGGPGIVGLSAGPHPIVRSDLRRRDGREGGDGLASEATVTLMSDNALTRGMIPNSDFVLRWSQTGDTVQESVFTHTGQHGNFLGILLQPPARVANPDAAVPRELVFVVDTSGSMRGKPLDAAKEVMEQLLATARPRDTFNIITFAGRTSVLWDRPRPATAQNQADAMAWLQSQQGGGGTEMMTAIEAALRQEPAPDDRELANRGDSDSRDVRRIRPLRLAVFLTDGEVGNDMAIIDAVRRHRDTTRVFTFGVGSSVNRYLLAGMATAGGGASEFVQLQHDGSGVSAGDLEAIIARFAERATTPLLTDIRVEATPGLNLMDFEPAMGNVPDVFDHTPVMILCRYPDIGEPVRGEVTISGMTGRGVWRKRIPVVLPAAKRRDADDGVDSTAVHSDASTSGTGHDVLATLWARRRIESLMNSDLTAAQRSDIDPEIRAKIVRLGETYSIMSAYTSFVAIDALRITVDGKPMLVHVPIELPAQTDWENYFGLDAASLEARLDDDAGAPQDKNLYGLAADNLINVAEPAAPSAAPNAGDPLAAGTGGIQPSAPMGGERESAPAKPAAKKDEPKGETAAGAVARGGGGGGGAADTGGKEQSSRSKDRATSAATTGVDSTTAPTSKPKIPTPPPPGTPAGPPAATTSAPPMTTASAPAPATSSAPLVGVSVAPTDARQRGDGVASRARAAGGASAETGSAETGSARRLAKGAQAEPSLKGLSGSSVPPPDSDFSNGFQAVRQRLAFGATTESLSLQGARSQSGGELSSSARSGAPLPSQLLAAAEVIRGVEIARRTGVVQEINDDNAIVAVQRSQQATPAQNQALQSRQAQSIARQGVVQNYNRVASSQSGNTDAARDELGRDQKQYAGVSPRQAPVPQELAQIEQQARAEFDRYARLVNKLDPLLAPAIDPAWRDELRAAMKARAAAGRSLESQATAKSTFRDTASNVADPTLDSAPSVPAWLIEEDQQALVDDPALVTVRLTTYSPAYVDALRAAGLDVLSISRDDALVIGRLRLADVEQVASLEEVAYVQVTKVVEDAE